MIDINQLKNTYFGIRHGQSHANVHGIIVAGEIARSEYGLTDLGKQQVRKGVEELKENGILNDHTIIVTSPLMRAKQTAEVAAEVLEVPQEHVIVDERLRERHFGVFEGKAHDAYKDVIWPADLAGTGSEHGVETTDIVLERLLELIEDLEQKYTNMNILLVSHGDTLQILETAFKNISSREHRSLVHLQNAEIRQYNTK